MVTHYTPASLCDHVHQATGHPGLPGMAWHCDHSLNTRFTTKDAHTSRPICPGCAHGAMRQASTDYRRIHRDTTTLVGQQSSLDAYTHSTPSFRNYRYTHILTDLASGQYYPVFTKDRSASELCARIGAFFDLTPNGTTIPLGLIALSGMTQRPTTAPKNLLRFAPDTDTDLNTLHLVTNMPTASLSEQSAL